MPNHMKVNDRTRANRDHQLAAIVDLYLVRYY